MSNFVQTLNAGGSKIGLDRRSSQGGRVGTHARGYLGNFQLDFFPSRAVQVGELWSFAMHKQPYFDTTDAKGGLQAADRNPNLQDQLNDRQHSSRRTASGITPIQQVGPPVRARSTGRKYAPRRALMRLGAQSDIRNVGLIDRAVVATA
jgi:hypothetical protein